MVGASVAWALLRDSEARVYRGGVTPMSAQRARVVIAPDSFKGSVSAADAARAIAQGWREVRPLDELVLVPLADGGEGTVEVCAAASPNAVRHRVTVRGPDDRPVDAEWLEVAEADDTVTGVIEFASASGITLLDAPRPHGAHSVGFGEVIRDALAAGCDRLLLGIGGSASTDGGQGMLAALGARFLDEHGADVGWGNAALGRIAEVDLSGLAPLPRLGAIVLSDVTNPLLGARGAVSVFGTQKGFTESEKPAAEAALAHLVEVVTPERATSPELPGAGAAGGTGWGLAVWGADIRPGSTVIGDLVRLPELLVDCQLVITGEGRFDEQSREGKVVGYVIDLAARRGVPRSLVAGQIALDATTVGSFVRSVALSDLAGDPSLAYLDPMPWLLRAGRDLAGAW